MSNSVATVDPQALATEDMFSDARIELIRNQVAVGAPDNVFAAMIDIARRRNLDPLARQIAVIRFGSNWQMITTIDGYRAIAEQTGQYGGSDAPVFTYEEPPRTRNNRTLPESCTVTVHKVVNGMVLPFSATVFMDEYDTGRNNWNTMPRTMIAKVAESHALRKAFPAVMSGLYTREEMDQAGVDTETGEIATPRPVQRPQQPRPKEPTQQQKPSATVQAAKEEKQHVPPKGIKFYDPELEPDPEHRKKVLAHFNIVLKDAGMDAKHRHALAWGAGYESSTTNVPSHILNAWAEKINNKPEAWKRRAEELMVDQAVALAEQEKKQQQADEVRAAQDAAEDTHEAEYREVDL